MKMHLQLGATLCIIQNAQLRQV